ncbi:hypothetical protein AciX9_4399 (plasmid) [Granulicella tundricola MP5ACTX9]|uniref:Uncharacterized protein n=2 Tax=Granulicella TaxID=940557 RepID=E8X7B6_GRATM|nr:hypothetical protein AciX9_4399 [Granulicella tundricola MP5ACTX9]
MRAELTQEDFEAQWRPIPLDHFPLPACSQGMILLKAFADAHPGPFEFIRPEDFVHYENEAFAGIEEWDAFARHCLSCHDCNEL